MIELTLDGRTIQVELGTTILEAARKAGVEIPTLCHHDGLTAEGNCRICMVEIEQRGKKRLVASCMFPIQGALTVETKSERVLEARRFVLQLLVNRNPKSPVIQKLAGEYNVTQESRFASEPDLCIRCGRCVRACEADGTHAIQLVQRGFDRKVAPPYEQSPESCIGCLACAEVCPTGKITYKNEKGTRQIWGRTFEVLACERCGAEFATPEQLAWADTEKEAARYCDHCRKAVFVSHF